MLPTPEPACFVIADISGYSSYLAGVELDHAQDIIADLVTTVLDALKPKFRLAKLEGDAIFVFAVGARHDGSALQDALEGAYFAFRRRLRNVRQSTTCECEACRQMEQLGLKFVCHHGEFIAQKVAGHRELAGSDVVVVHRLLKNEAAERLQGRAYALFTEAWVTATDMLPAAQGLLSHRESLEVGGEIDCWLSDLEAAWSAESNRQRIEVSGDQVAMSMEFEIAAPRSLVWEHFTQPDLRPIWRGADSVIEAVVDGRRGVGTTNHCMHGKEARLEEVLDWRPYDYMTMSTLLPLPDAPKVVLTYAFAETADGGTAVEIRAAKPEPKYLPFLEQVAPRLRQEMSGEVEVLRGLLAVEQAPEDA